MTLAALEAPGRPVSRLSGGWVDDLCALQKFITLCPFCDHKFSPRAHHYEPWRRDLYCVARCDGCNRIHPRCKAFIHETYHEALGDWTRQRRGRWAT